MERFSTLVGPISWGIIVAFLPTVNGVNYRIAIASMTVFILLGLYILYLLESSINKRTISSFLSKN